ncbi:zinc-binding dehydrogenase [Chryseobacterium sp. 52]|uniref:zinc-binding dehydrogenase n=1 Tax=Chryseobacterium sp. 52 TaxID=2035213 RepID=UPI001E28D30A|nr:zinc-binding dehydrogenase [Chryseobacterium sp. 52]
MQIANGKQLSEIALLVESGTIRPVIDRVFPFEETDQTLEYVKYKSKNPVVHWIFSICTNMRLFLCFIKIIYDLLDYSSLKRKG